MMNYSCFNPPKICGNLEDFLFSSTASIDGISINGSEEKKEPKVEIKITSKPVLPIKRKRYRSYT